MHSQRAFAVVLTLFSFQLAACSGGGDEDLFGDEAVASLGQAATASWISPACDEDGLSSPSGPGGSCDGPYRYSRDPDCTEAHPDCGPEMIKSCYHWDNGIAYKLPYNSSTTRQVTCTETCSGRHLECSIVCGKFNPQNSATWCSQAAADKELALEALPDPAFFTATEMYWMRQTVRVTAGTVTGGSTEPELVVNSPTRKVFKWKIIQTCPMNISGHPVKVYAANKTYCGTDGYPVCDHCPRVDGIMSAPGASFASLGPDIVASECMTCDHVPDTGKAQCLLDKLDAPTLTTANNFDYHNALVARLKLFFELHPELLTPAQRERVLELYASDPAAPSCASPLPDQPGCSAALNGLLEACHALTLPHVGVATASGQLDACLAAFDLVAAESDPACRDAGADVVADVVALLFDRAVDGHIAPGSGGVPTGLAPALTAVDSWYDHAAVAAPDADWLRRRTSAVVDIFWRHAYGATLALPDTVSSGNVDAVLADLSGTGRTVDQAVLSAAFSSASTIDSPPLLLIVGDALVATVEKLRFVSVAHDLACQYQSCSPSANDDVTLQLWRVLASLHDATELSAALAAAPRLASQHPALHAALSAVAARHDRLAAAWTAAGGEGSLDDLLEVESPAWATGLRVIVGEAAARWAQALATGSTTGRDGRVLHAGVQQEAEIRNLLTQREAGLTHALEEYQDSKVILVNAVLQQLQGAQAEESIRQEMTRIGEQVLLLTADMMGARGREAAESARFADVAGAFLHLLEIGVFDEDVAASTDVQPQLVVSGQGALYDGSGTQTPAQLAVRTVPLTRGQQLRISATGEWSPSCALQRAHLPGPAGDTYQVGNKDALIGPEGYRVQWSGSEYTADSFGHGWSVSTEISVKACFHAEAGFTAFGNGAKATLDACVGNAFNSSINSNHSSGSDARTSASFSGGLRLAETPFRDAPAGALLLVATEPGTAVVVDVQVAQRQSVYVAPGNVDVHFIVNDLDHGGCMVRADALTVELLKVTSLGAIGGPLSQAMATTLGGIEAQSAEILAQGALLGGEATALRSMAWTTLATEVGMSLDALPPGVTGFFGAWLDKELASLERRAYIAGLERQIDAQMLRLSQLDQELGAAIAQSRLLSLIPRWRARNLAAQEISPELLALMQILEDYAPPVFELRYPDERAALLTSAAPQLQALRGITLDGDAEDVISAVLALSQRVRWTLETAAVDLSTEGLTQVALVFPRPEGTAAGCELFGTCFTSIWRIATQLIDPWFDLGPTGVVTLHVSPEDLYSPHGGVARLDCDDHAPVIHRMGLYLVFTDDIDLTPYNLRLPVTVGRRQLFPTAAGLLAYQTAREETSLSVRVSSGLDQNALVRLPATETVGQGLSPFADFSVDLNALPPEHLAAASAVVLVLELERHRPGPDAALPGVCQPLP